MKHILLTLTATLATMSLLVAGAAAETVELGMTKTSVTAPECPKNLPPAQCTIILTQTTGLETIRDGTIYPTTAKKDGFITAFTLGLSRLSNNRSTALSDIKYLDKTYGGTTRAGITVLAPVIPRQPRPRKGHRRKPPPVRTFTWKVVASSPIFRLQPYLGEVVQFPLQQALPIKKGYVVALTVPTWAPVLTINQPMSRFAYRQSRTTACTSPPVTDTSQQSTGQTAKYTCDYPGTRVEYSATEVVTPVPPKDYVH